MKHILTTIAAVVLVGCGPSMSIHDAVNEGNIESVKRHLAAGTDVNTKDYGGYTPLDVAIWRNRTEITDLLRKHGGKSGAKDSIHVAANTGNIEAVTQHLADGADVNAKMKEGTTPLHFAASKGHKEIAELLKMITDGETPLHKAAYEGHKEIAELLIAEGADVNVKNGFGETPLHRAASRDHKEVAELLIAEGADVNAKIKYGLTPLHLAAASGYKEIVELLTTKDADVNAKGFRGSTPLDITIKQKHPEAAALLRKHGGKTGEELKTEEK